MTFQSRSTGASALFLNITLASPQASNLIDYLPPILSGPGILIGWSARYLLLDPAGATMANYFRATYGASTLATFPNWTVLTLPLDYPADPIGPL